MDSVSMNIMNNVGIFSDNASMDSIFNDWY